MIESNDQKNIETKETDDAFSNEHGPYFSSSNIDWESFPLNNLHSTENNLFKEMSKNLLIALSNDWKWMELHLKYQENLFFWWSNEIFSGETVQIDYQSISFFKEISSRKNGERNLFHSICENVVNVLQLAIVVDIDRSSIDVEHLNEIFSPVTINEISLFSKDFSENLFFSFVSFVLVDDDKHWHCREGILWRIINEEKLNEYQWTFLFFSSDFEWRNILFICCREMSFQISLNWMIITEDDQISNSEPIEKAMFICIDFIWFRRKKELKKELKITNDESFSEMKGNRSIERMRWLLELIDRTDVFFLSVHCIDRATIEMKREKERLNSFKEQWEKRFNCKVKFVFC